MGFSGGGGATGTTAHVHSAAAGQGGILSTATVLTASTITDQLNTLTTGKATAGPDTIDHTRAVTGITAAAGSARYIGLIAYHVVSATETASDDKVSQTGIFTNMKMVISANTYNKTLNVVSRINASDGNQVITIPATNTGTFEDTTNKDNVWKEDLVDIKTSGSSGSGSVECTDVEVIYSL